MLRLKLLLGPPGCRQADLARALKVSTATVAQIVNHGSWPKSLPQETLEAGIRAFLSQANVPAADIATAFEVVGQTRANAPAPVSPQQTTDDLPKEDSMLLRKQTLHPATKKHFSLFRDPFAEDAIQSDEDMYVSPDIRYVRESMFSAAKFGGLLAIVAESGAGKTTLLRDLEERIEREHQQIVLIRPYVLGMEDNDQKGKTLKASHIAEAIMATVAPLERPKSSPEARFRQLHQVLRESHAAGYRHCLVIDEAHALPVPTIKHLKRFFELETGFKKLLSIILIGQPELQAKLSERNADVREVVQRCEMVELPPLDGGRLDDYLRFKLERAGKAVADVIDAGGIDAIRAKLTVTAQRRDKAETVSLLYPLAVGNLMTAALNVAAEIGSPLVTADVVRSL